MLAIKMKKASKNHLIKNLNKSKIQKLNKNIIIHRIRLVNQRKDKKKKSNNSETQNKGKFYNEI